MRLYGRPKRKCASITSSPLFASVAESIVIFAPMFQVGCASASAGVTSRELVSRAAAERPTARGEDDRLRLAGEGALEERRVLTVDRDQRSAPALTRREREVARSDEALLVGERERDAVLERPHRPGQAGKAEGRVQDDVRLRALQERRRVAAHLRQRSEPVDRCRAGCGGHELERRVAGDHLDRLAPDRSGGTEERNPRHGHSVPRHTRGVRALLLAVAVAAAVAALPAAAGNRVEGVPAFGPVFVLIGENTDYQHVDATDSPFMMNNAPAAVGVVHELLRGDALVAGELRRADERAVHGLRAGRPRLRVPRRRRQRVPPARGRAAARGTSGSRREPRNATPARAGPARATTHVR